MKNRAGNPILPKEVFGRLAAVAVVAFGLRAGVAVATESLSIFPSYYFTDAMTMDRLGWEKAEASARGETRHVLLAPGHRIQVFVLSRIYGLIGHHPIVPKLMFALAGAAAVFAFGAALLPVFGSGPSIGAAALTALWPSHVFYTSQLFKEGPVLFLVYLALCGGIRLLIAPRSHSFRQLLPAIAMTVAGLTATGFFRSYLMLVLSMALGAAALWGLLRMERSRALASTVIIALAIPPLYMTAAKTAFRWQVPEPTADTLKDPGMKDNVVPKAFDYQRKRYVSPFSPAGISEFRNICQLEDRRLAVVYHQREIGTQIFPYEVFEDWFDVMFFFPRAAFTVLYMPLPGLYPMEGKVGRMLASCENVVLLVLSLCAGAALWRGAKSIGRLMPILIFLAMATGSAFFEFDLGSASRHKLLYMPFLFPFAAEGLLGLLRRERFF